MNGIAPHGKTDPAIIREIFLKQFHPDYLTDSEIALILEEYVGFLHDEVETSDQYEVLPGIYEILDEMTARTDVMLGLATGNVETGARIKLRRSDLNRYF